jgi:2,4-dienoyl-CoA reductase-like NADH-dependent reductase (Old Yellow Enzyme family)
MSTPLQLAAQPFDVAGLQLRNRIVGTAHGRGLVEDGLALPGDAEYWRRRAAGGVAMLTVGGTVTAPESTWRRRITSEAWRPEAVPGMAARAEAIRSEGAVAAAQIVHLGRETLGLETWYHPVGPSAVRSPREPTRPRALTDGELDAIVEGFRVSAVHAAQAGFQVVELHAAHAYLLAQFLSPMTNRRPGEENAATRARIVARVAAAIRASAPVIVLGIRLSIDGGEEAGFTLDGLCELLPHIGPLVDYVNVTVGVRTTYVRDMATVAPPLLDHVGTLRGAVDRPLLVSQAFRTGDAIEAALAAGADLVGLARPLIADPDIPRKLLAGRAEEVRPCVSCNEECRAFDPALLCTVNPDIGPTADAPRPAEPLVVGRAARGDGGRVAIVGAGPAGLECATALAGARPVVLFDRRSALGGELASAAAAPNRRGWRALLDFYAAALARAGGVEIRLGVEVGPGDLDGFDEVVLAIGSDEVLPAVPGIDRARASAQAIAAGPDEFGGRSRLVVVDDGFGWWPAASAVELGVRAGFAAITFATLGGAFGATLPPEGRVQLLGRLRGAPLEVRPFTALDAIDDVSATLRNVMSGATETVTADSVIVVGERVARDWSGLVPEGATTRVIGDAIVPRKVMHAIAEGRAAAAAIAGDAHAMRTSVLPTVSPASIRARASGARPSPSTIDSR